ncbi:thiolase family protein [Microbacterium capsulatum]|uniref:Thiolase family protein n=1 Tax=Microbacterium capsulatum TaxID=3041921 RepID=A0ABU0XL90_9MICO|nr:thiolase family protein [Microbacterium sp. ASV81]MDQ4214490.1 thiolase family protein [Microbacterium sp. ASV81]
MRDAVIATAVRSPVGRRKGALAGLHPVDLSAAVLNALVARAGIDPSVVDDVIWGCVGQAGEQASNIGRNAVLSAGWPVTVPGTTVERQCGSSQQAIHFAAAAVISGQNDIVVAGGVENMTRIPLGTARRNGPGDPFSEQLLANVGASELNQGRGAEILAKRHGLSREWLDELALQSHQRAAAAQDAGHFAEEIVPIMTEDGVFSADEGIRRSSTIEALAALAPVFGEDGRMTAGNSSQISDGSSAVIITTSEKARELGITPLVRVHATAVVGSDPIAMLDAPGPATHKVLSRAGLGIDDIGTFEVNEAFASVVGAWFADTGVSREKVNPDGGAIALGHPLGGSGARLTATLVHRMVREGHRYGLQTMCEGGGMANATIYENLQI